MSSIFSKINTFSPFANRSHPHNLTQKSDRGNLQIFSNKFSEIIFSRRNSKLKNQTKQLSPLKHLPKLLSNFQFFMTTFVTIKSFYMKKTRTQLKTAFLSEAYLELGPFLEISTLGRFGASPFARTSPLNSMYAKGKFLSRK